MCIGQGVAEADVMFLDGNCITEAKDIVLADAVNDFRRCQSVDLFGKDVVQPFFPVRIELSHARTVVEPFHDFRDVHAGLHVEVGEGLCIIIKAAGILFFQQVHHVLHHFFRRENLVCLLRRNIVENIFRVFLVEVVGQLLFLVHEFLYRIIENHFIEKVSFKMFLVGFVPDFMAFVIFLVIVSAVPEEAELFQSDAGHVFENALWYDLVEVRQGDGIIRAIGHKERRNSTGETSQVVTYAAFDGLLLLVLLVRLHPFHNGLPGFCQAILDLFGNGFLEVLVGLFDLLLVVVTDLLLFFRGFHFLELFIPFGLGAADVDAVVIYSLVQLFTYTVIDVLFQTVPSLFGQVALIGILGLVKNLLRGLLSKLRLQVFYLLLDLFLGLGGIFISSIGRTRGFKYIGYLAGFLLESFAGIFVNFLSKQVFRFVMNCILWNVHSP